MSDGDRESVIERAVVAMLWVGDGPVRQTHLIQSLGVTARDLLDLEGQGLVISELVDAEGAGRPVRVYRLPYAPLDPEAVRSYTVSKGLCNADDTAPVSPPEFRNYEAYLRHQDGMARAAEAREQKEAAATRRRQRADLIAGWPHTRMPRIRAWAKQQDLDVGLRGRLPRWVVDKYDQEVDDQAELHAALKNLGLSDGSREGADTDVS
ncbi:Lsr2 family DNA-binding protein [Streptomyces crystallinus]|uniref:Lsr2 DNA-binding domain-containing protein n=1 Tax=Streptomyces crystallinus TaxID=68191 RepID=A0ABN1F0W6_9ACTN